MNGQAVAIPRTKFRFKLVSLNQSPEALVIALDQAGAVGFALAVNTALTIGETGPGSAVTPKGFAQYLLLAQPMGVDIVGPGLLG